MQNAVRVNIVVCLVCFPALNLSLSRLMARSRRTAGQVVCFRTPLLPGIFCCVIENLNLFCTRIQILFPKPDTSPKNNLHPFLGRFVLDNTIHHLVVGCGLVVFPFCPNCKPLVTSEWWENTLALQQICVVFFLVLIVKDWGTCCQHVTFALCKPMQFRS